MLQSRDCNDNRVPEYASSVLELCQSLIFAEKQKFVKALALNV